MSEPVIVAFSLILQPQVGLFSLASTEPRPGLWLNDKRLIDPEGAFRLWVMIEQIQQKQRRDLEAETARLREQWRD